MDRSSVSFGDVFPAERAEVADVRLGLSTLLPPGPVFVTSVDNDTWAARNNLSKGAEIFAIGPKHVKVSGLTTKAFMEAVRDRPLDLDIRLSDSKGEREVNSLLSQGSTDIRWPPARPVWPYIVGDNLDVNASSQKEPTELTLAIPKNVNARQGSDKRSGLESPTPRSEVNNIDTIEDALRAAHQHAMAEAKRYWRCELAISETKLRCHMARIETEEMRDQIASEPQEAAVELRQASEMREEALVVAKQVGDSEMRLSELHLEVATKTSDARHVARHFTQKKQNMDNVRDSAQKQSSLAQSDRQLADARQEEAAVVCRKAEPVFEMLSHVESEARQMRFLLKTEQVECDKQHELKGRLRREILDLRNHEPPGQAVKVERDTLLRELRELNKLTRDRTNDGENLRVQPVSVVDLEDSQSLLQPSTPPPLVKRGTLAAAIASKRESFIGNASPDVQSRSFVESPLSSQASPNTSPNQATNNSRTGRIDDLRSRAKSNLSKTLSDGSLRQTLASRNASPDVQSRSLAESPLSSQASPDMSPNKDSERNPAPTGASSNSTRLSGNRSSVVPPLRASKLALRSSRSSSLDSKERNSGLLLQRLSTTSFTTNIMRQTETTVAGLGDEDLFERLAGGFDQAVEFLRNDLVGKDRLLEGPFGPRVKVYLDYTAAGQGLMSINRYMAWLKEHFANTHTEDSATGRFMTSAFDDALKSIETCVNAKDKFTAICTGTGTTGALLRLQQILGIYIPPSAWKQLELLTCTGLDQVKDTQVLDVQGLEHISLQSIPNPPIKTTETLPFSGECPVWWRARERVKAVIRDQKRLPLVFVGGYEHHSNELSWRYGLCDCIRISLTKDFALDLEELENLLQHHRKECPYRPIIGSFSACSNVTGMRTDLYAVSKLVRAVQGKFFVDFAASGPYQVIDCCPDDNPDLFDGFVLSPHKFLGGDGSCGLLMLRKSIYDWHLPPTFAGGGTVKFVGQNYHAFSDDIVERENAGTPGALQIYQTALAFEVKELVGPENIEQREAELLEDFFGWVKENYSREICILGNLDPKLRQSIVAFNIIAPQPLHPRFVTVLLSDVFGVQTRAGCSCAGPHGLDLLGGNPDMEKLFFSLMVGEARGYKIADEPEHLNMFSLKPGWCRLNLHYIMDEDEMWYLKEVLSFVIAHGAKFLSVYSFDACNGSWAYKPPDSEMKAMMEASRKYDSKDGEHRFGLHGALGCTKPSRKLKDALRSRRHLLESQLRDATLLLEHLSDSVTYCSPPAPFPEINLPGLGPQPFFVIAEGQIHNVENMTRKMKEWEMKDCEWKPPTPQRQISDA